MTGQEAVPDATLHEMTAYYGARADEYDEWFYRQGRHDLGPEFNARWFGEVELVSSALESLDLSGDVLELAAGTGIWTQRLASTARSVTAVDAAPEMIALNRARVRNGCLTYVIADLFTWQPKRAYDAVVFAFWLSHVPTERLDDFLAMVVAAVRPGGAVFFLDSRREPDDPAADRELHPSSRAQMVTRHLNDGRAFQVVKNFYEPETLAARFAAAGLDMTVRETPTYFIYGMGTRTE